MSIGTSYQQFLIQLNCCELRGKLTLFQCLLSYSGLWDVGGGTRLELCIYWMHNHVHSINSQLYIYWMHNYTNTLNAQLCALLECISTRTIWMYHFYCDVINLRKLLFMIVKKLYVLNHVIYKRRYYKHLIYVSALLKQ